jgi:hypothetical protein
MLETLAVADWQQCLEQRFTIQLAPDARLELRLVAVTPLGAESG